MGEPTKRPDGEAQAGTLTDALLAKLEGLARLYGTACYWHGSGAQPERHFYDHVEQAWANFKAALASAAPQQAEAPALKALEFAEYMAKRAEYLIDSLDTLMAKQSFVDGAAHDDHRPLKVDQLEAARGDAIEASRAMRRDIYEFRKRAEKVSATPAPKALKGYEAVALAAVKGGWITEKQAREIIEQEEIKPQAMKGGIEGPYDPDVARMLKEQTP